MKLREPSLHLVNPDRGVLEGGNGRYVKRLADLTGLYADAAAFAAASERDGDSIVYDVTEFRPSTASGDLIFGITHMVPGRIGAEFFLTRGHLHARADRPEIYRGEAGRGVMLLEAPDGETRALDIGPRAICYVPPYWIHRSINVGAEPLVLSFCYPADAGQDYAIIANSFGMRQRVVSDGGAGWRLADNPAYRPRSPAAIAALFAAEAAHAAI